MSDLDSVSQGGQEGAGAYLRQAREAQGMTIEQLASTVKVPTTKLLALERNDWDVLPDANFNRALAMTVCRALKVDAGPALSRMPAAVAVSLASAKPPLNQPFRDFSHTGLTFESSPSLSLRVPKLPPALIAPLVLLILAAGIYFMPDHFDLKTLLPHSDDAASQMVQGEHGPAVTEDRPEVAQSASGASATAGGASAVDLPEIAASSSVAAVLPAASEASVSVAASAVAPAPSVAKAAVAVVGAKDSSPSAAASAPVGLAPVAQASAAQAVARGGAKLVLTAKSPSWVEILDGNGQKLISRQLASGESTEIQGAPPLKVHAGNAPALTVVFNGQPVDLGPVTRQNVARIELK